MESMNEKEEVKKVLKKMQIAKEEDFDRYNPVQKKSIRKKLKKCYHCFR